MKDMCYRKEVKPTLFLIELTQSCNLDCRYCFRGEHPNQKISLETLTEVLEAIYQYSVKYQTAFSIQPWGGEPLLELDKIIFIREFFNKKGIKPPIHVETNGLLLTPNNLMKMLVNDIKFGISIDGHAAIQDKQRPLAGGQGSYALLKDNITHIHERYPELKLAGITVITKDSYQSINQIIDTLVKELHFTSLKINLVKGNEQKEDVKELNTKEIKWLYKKVFWRINYLISKGYPVSEGNIVTRASNLFNGEMNDICLSHGCSGGYRMLAFDVTGAIFNCELIGNEGQRIGTYQDDFIEAVNKSIASGNSYFVKKEAPKCLKCHYQEYCQGGCNSHLLYTKEEVDEQMCAVNKTLYPLIKLARIMSLPITKLFPRRK